MAKSKSKKGVSSSSKEAYDNIQNLPQKRKDVYGAIKALKECCDVDIAQYLGWPINRVTGRRYELENLGLIESVGKKLSNHSNVAVYHWKIKD